jgi:hypothetical protein
MPDEVYAMVPISYVAAPVGHRAFRVLVALMAHADVTGACHPSNNRLADVTGLDRRNVIHALGELAKAELIELRTEGRSRSIQVKGSVKATLPGVKTTPSDNRKGSVKTATGVVSKQPPHMNRPENREEKSGGVRVDGVKTTLPPDDIAGRLTVEVFGLVDDAGGPDWNVAAMIGHAIRGKGYPEATLFANAHKAVATARVKPPHIYFLDMLGYGLREIPPAPTPAVANGTHPAPRESAAARRKRELAEQVERAKAARAAKEGRHAGA